MRPWALLLVLLGPAAALTSCGGVSAQNAEYPDLKVNSRGMELEVEEVRKNVLEPILEPNKLYQNEQASFPQQLPQAFEEQAGARLTALSSADGLRLKVTAVVELADLTFRNDHNGDTVRYDVRLGLRIATEKGTLLQKGKGQSSQELPYEEASPAEMKRIFLAAALNAFDQYFADEDTLEKLNSNIEAYLKAHPAERN
jgi:hypothetical protein